MAGVLLWVISPKENATALFSLIPRRAGKVQKRSRLCPGLKFSTGVSAFSTAVVNPARSSEEKVYEVVLKQAALVKEQSQKKALDLKRTAETEGMTDWDLLSEAYERCGEVCAEYAKTFYLGTLLMTPERRRAVWAIYGMWIQSLDVLHNERPLILHFENFNARICDLILHERSSTALRV